MAHAPGAGTGSGRGRGPPCRLEERTLLSVTFDPAVNYAAGTEPFSVAVGDFNGDGKPDLAVANVDGNNVSVLLATATAPSRPRSTTPPGRGPVSVAVADLNGDGKPDLAVANDGGNNVSVLLGNGDGTFAAAGQLRRRARAPSRSRWRTSTATASPTSPSPTTAATT